MLLAIGSASDINIFAIKNLNPQAYSKVELEYVKTISGHTDYVKMITNMPDSDEIISCSSDKTIRIWKVSTGECLRTYEGHANGVECISLIGNTHLVSASTD